VLDRARSAADHLPRWALVTIAVATIALVGEVAFLIARSGEDGGSSEADAALPCNDRAADDAVNADRFAQAVRDLGTVPPLSGVLEVYDAKVVGCADLTADGVDEMVVRLPERDLSPEDLAEAPIPWAIYRAEDETWTPSLIRTHVPGAGLTIRDGLVREVSRGFAEGDSLCCPTGERGGEVRWDGEDFTYRPDRGPRGRTIALAEGEAAAIGGFDVRTGSLPAATALFGPPSSYTPQGEACPATWADLGLAIVFANFGGLDPCGPEGRVSTARVEAPEAAQAGWRTQEGATVDMPVDELRELGIERETPTLSALVDGGRVIGFEIAVNAAGEP
jgi:hypothetical protein